MFDSFNYVVITNIIIFISVFTFLGLITKFIFKRIPPSIIDCILVAITLIGMYLYIPYNYCVTGFKNEDTDKLYKAINLSINPYEKRLCWSFLASIYANDISKQGIKDGNKAIVCMEKALKGEYAKYKLETGLLAIWYSYKGDKDKVLELSKIIRADFALRNIYIQNNEYAKAISTFEGSKETAERYLKADLHKKLKDYKNAKKEYNIAEKVYKTQLAAYSVEANKTLYKKNVSKYRSVEAYKKWLEQQRKEYKFN